MDYWLLLAEVLQVAGVWQKWAGDPDLTQHSAKLSSETCNWRADVILR